MALADTLANARDGLKESMRKYNFKKANRSRQEIADMTAAMAKCRGQLEICLKDFNRTIKGQSRNIAEGKRLGADTLIQEQMLWDAAIGYMLVKDAIYALKTINNNDSISHAYDILDAAVSHMKGGKPAKAFKVPFFMVDKKRSEYGAITSEEAVKNKEEILDSFFETLKLTGDIETCLDHHRNPVQTDARRQVAAINGTPSSLESSVGQVPVTTADNLESLLNGIPDDGDVMDNFDDSLLGNSISDIHHGRD